MDSLDVLQNPTLHGELLEADRTGAALHIVVNSSHVGFEALLVRELFVAN